MEHTTIRTIINDHLAIAAMLRSAQLLLRQNKARREEPDFAVLRAMLFYLDEFPQMRHHRKETELLFPKLRARTPLARELLDRLDHDHHSGEARIREVEHRLLGFEMMGESRRAAFEQALDAYVRFYLDHMAAEEREVLPLAQRVLQDADWVELDATFAQDRDPLTGGGLDAEYARLFTKIVNITPAPIGLG